MKSNVKSAVMSGYIKIPNDTMTVEDWDPSMLLVYCYLAAHDKCGNGVTKTYEEIANDTGISVSTVFRSIDALDGYDLINRQNRKYKKRNGTNRYFVRKAPTENYYLLPRFVTELKLTPRQFKVYCYFCFRRGSGLSAWSSFRSMARELRISTRTLQDAMKELSRLGLIDKKRRWYRNKYGVKTGAHRSNEYFKKARFTRRLGTGRRRLFRLFQDVISTNAFSMLKKGSQHDQSCSSDNDSS